MIDTFSERMRALSPGKRALLELILREKAIQSSLTQQILQTPEADSCPLSFAQERLWFLNQLEPRRSRLAPQILADNLCRHRWMTGPRHSPALPLPLPVVELQHITEDEQEAVALWMASKEVRRARGRQ